MSPDLILKLQVSQYTTQATRRILIYNKERTFLVEREITPQELALMGDKPKKYFRARMEGKVLRVLDRVEDQDW